MWDNLGVKNNKKKLVIISGVTGAIGSALFATYGQRKDTVVYGISRKAQPVDVFSKGGKMPLATLICSIGEGLDYRRLFKEIDYSCVSEVVYVHALGLYPFEVDNNGSIKIENDNNGDGINDEVNRLTFESFVSATSTLNKCWEGKSKCIIFAGIADKHRPLVHQSWWKTIEKVKEYMIKTVSDNSNMSMLVFSISSVLCPHEVITRPFVFTDTDADQRYWLDPYELAKYVVNKTDSTRGYREYEKFRIKPGFKEDSYYKDRFFTPRKVKELFN